MLEELDMIMCKALCLLKSAPNLTPKQLGSKLGLNATETYYLLAALEQNGYITHSSKLVKIDLYKISNKGLEALRNNFHARRLGNLTK